MARLMWGSRYFAVALAVTGTVAMSVGVILGHWVIPPPDSSTTADSNLDAAPTTNVPATTLVATPSETASPTEPAAEPDTTADAFPGAPTRINEFGVPVGYPRTEAGAISACGNYVSAYTSIENREPSRIRELFRSFSLESENQKLSQRIIDVDAETANNFGVQSVNSPAMNFNLRVVGFGVDSFSAEEATVSIWSIGAVGIYEGPPNLLPQEHWGTDVCTVRWVGEDWKLSNATDGSDGPVPAERDASKFRRFVLLGGAK